MPTIDFRTGQRIERPAVPARASVTPTPSKRKRGSRPEEMRKALLAKVHVAKKQLALTEPEYRALLDGHFGTDTAAALDVTDLKRLVLVMQEYGFKPKRGSAKRGANRRASVPATLDDADDILQRRPLMEKIEALLAEKGRMEGSHVPWGYAVAVLKRLSGGVTRCLEHATPGQLQNVIAALMYDARRHGRRVS